jgi:hypothetical protein
MASSPAVDVERPKRLSHFVEVSVLQFTSQTQPAGLFDGRVVDNRMDILRTEIEYIRRHWNRYAEFSSDLRRYLLDKYEGNEKTGFEKAVDAICGNEKSWTEPSIDYGALNVYTSTFGHKEVFSISSTALRDDSVITDSKAARSNVFLTELLNIDLFHLHQGKEGARNFTGTVYRGLVVSEEELQQFRDLSRKDIRHRVLAVPLATMSATRNLRLIMTY